MNFIERAAYAFMYRFGKVILRFIGTPSVAALHYEHRPETLEGVHMQYEICGVPECGLVIEIPIEPNGSIDPDWYRLALLEHSMCSGINHPEVTEVGDRFDIFGEEL